MLTQQEVRSISKPSEAQAEAGNYRMAKIRVHGLDITIETPKGRRRNPAWPPLAAHYGYVRGTLGRDGDHVDVFVGPHPESELAVVVDQLDAAGKFDEHKALIGYRTTEDAIACYRKCYTPGWKVGPVTTMTVEQFKAWLKDGSQAKPLAPQVSRFSADFAEAILERYMANWDQRLAALWQRRDPEGIERAAPTASLREALAAAFAQRTMPPPPTMAEQFSALFSEALLESYAARGPRNSPGQLGMFGDGLGGNRPLRSPSQQQRLDWDSSKHPRDPEGKFTEKGTGSTVPKGKAKTPFVYPSGETQAIGPDGRPAGIEAPTLKNDEASDGDQLGLLDGEGKRADRKKFDTPEAGKGRQRNLIDGLDAGAGQMDFFGGDGTPDDLVFKPGDGDAKNPREAVDEAQEEADADYEFARTSAVPNAGEDLKGSARHTRNAWRSLDDAEADGTAEAMVTRDQLLKNEPHELGIHVDKEPITTLLMHEALRAFPPKPGYGSRRTDAETQKNDRKHYLQAYRDIKKAAEDIAASGESDPRAAASKLARTVKSTIEQLRREHGSYNNTANGLINFHNRLASSHKKTALVRAVGQAVLTWKEKTGLDGPAMREPFIDAVHEVIGGKSLTSVMGGGTKGGNKNTFNPADLYVAHASREGGPESPAKSAKEANAFLVNKAGFRGVQYGNSVSDKEREHHATMAAAAMVDLADITGLPVEAIGLNGKLGLAIGARGRANALAHYEPGTKVINLTRKKGVGSLAHEWAHALDHEMAGGEPPMMSFGSKADALFHSEDSGISRTGQMIDGKWVSKAEDRTGEPKFKAMQSLRDSMKDSGYGSRLRTAMREHGISGTKAQYWTSHREMFARCFERFAQRKLEKAGRKNTYLAGIETKAYKNGGLWPTDAEIDQMAPHFEAVLAAHRKEAHGLHEPVKYSASDRQFHTARMAATLMGMTTEQYSAMHAEADHWLAVAEKYRSSAIQSNPKKSGSERELVRGEQGDLGYFVTIDGHPVFVEAKSGIIRRGPRHLRDHPVEAVPGNKLRRSRRIRPDRSGDRNSPGQKGMFGNGIGGDVLRSPKTQPKMGLSDAIQGTVDKPTAEGKTFVPRTRVDRTIVDEIGEDLEDVKIFRDMMGDAHKMLLTEAHEINDDLRNLLNHFGYSGKRTSQIVQLVRRTDNKGGDHDQIARFDEMADVARRNYPRLLAGPLGESVGAGDDEQALMERLKQGFETLPSRTDDRVISLARQMWDRHQDYDGAAAGAHADDWGDVLEDDLVPFAATFAEAFIERYMASMAD